jgi:alcohol dehydrogenase class IV
METLGEIYQPAFPLATKPYISAGLPFHEACARHVTDTKASRVYVIVSSSISKTANFERLQAALSDKITAVREGIRPHTPWDDVREIIIEARDKTADMIVTLGVGSLTDGAKVISFVSRGKHYHGYDHN